MGNETSAMIPGFSLVVELKVAVTGRDGQIIPHDESAEVALVASSTKQTIADQFGKVAKTLNVWLFAHKADAKLLKITTRPHAPMDAACFYNLNLLQTVVDYVVDNELPLTAMSIIDRCEISLEHVPAPLKKNVESVIKLLCMHFRTKFKEIAYASATDGFLKHRLQHHIFQIPPGSDPNLNYTEPDGRQ
jgi:hypothetical protein